MVKGEMQWAVLAWEGRVECESSEGPPEDRVVKDLVLH